MENTLPVAFHIGPWLVQSRLHRLSCEGEVVALEPRVMQVLLVLAAHAGQVVLREELLAAVWPDQVVTEEALTRCISALRSAFGDDYQNPTVIETIRKTGYRLIMPVSFHQEPGHRKPGRGAPAPRVTMPSIAARPPLRRWPWVLPWLGVVSLVALGAYLWRSTAAPSASLRIVPFTAFAGNEMQPAFSPDGNHVAFAWDGREGTRLDVYVQSIGTATPYPVARDSAYEVSPTWSPDGSRLAFARVWRTCEIVTAPLLGGPERTLAECGGWGNPHLDWSPDATSSLMAISEAYDRGDPFRIVLLDLETLEKRPLTSPAPQHQGDRLPRFSPDGKTVAFVRTTDAVSDIFLVPVSGGPPSRLTFDNEEVDGLAWTPDGRSLVYTTNRTGTHSLWRIPVQGGPATLVLAGGESMSNPALAAQGGLLAYEQWSNETSIYRLPLAPGGEAQPEAFLRSTRWDAEPQYAPDAGRVAFVSNRTGTFEIWLSEADGTGAVPLTTFGGSVTRHPAWSPDGARLAFDARVDGNADIYLVDVAGRRPRRLTTAPSLDTRPAWSPDGRWIFFASDRSGAWEVWKMPSEGGEAVQVTHRGGFAPRAAPGGSRLYFVRPDTAGIWQMPLEGGAASQVTALLPPAYTDAWTVTSAGLYFLRPRDEAGMTLTLLEAATSRVVDVAVLPVANRRPGLTVSPDGRWALYARLDRSESDLMLVEGLR